MTDEPERAAVDPQYPAPAIPPGGVLLVAVLAMSWGGPLVRYATAPALAVAGWRVAFSVLIITAVVLLRDRGRRIRALSGRDWALAAASGAFLAGHFWSWIASLSLTTVASSVVLVNTQPVFVALLSSAFLGERPSPRQWVGIGVAVMGAAVIGWGDFAGGGTPFWATSSPWPARCWYRSTMSSAVDFASDWISGATSRWSTVWPQRSCSAPRARSRTWR